MPLLIPIGNDSSPVALEVCGGELTLFANREIRDRVTQGIGDTRIVAEGTEVDDRGSERLHPFPGLGDLRYSRSDRAPLLTLERERCLPVCIRSSQRRKTRSSTSAGV